MEEGLELGVSSPAGTSDHPEPEVFFFSPFPAAFVSGVCMFCSWSCFTLLHREPWNRPSVGQGPSRSCAAWSSAGIAPEVRSPRPPNPFCELQLAGVPKTLFSLISSPTLSITTSWFGQRSRKLAVFSFLLASEPHRPPPRPEEPVSPGASPPWAPVPRSHRPWPCHHVRSCHCGLR